MKEREIPKKEETTVDDVEDLDLLASYQGAARDELPLRGSGGSLRWNSVRGN
jgi:hypothetical protein